MGYVDSFDSASECADETLVQFPDASGVNYGHGYSIDVITSCYTFNNCGDDCAIKKISNESITSCLYTDRKNKYRQVGENCGNGWDGHYSYFCGECDEGLHCCNELNPQNDAF